MRSMECLIVHQGPEGIGDLGVDQHGQGHRDNHQSSKPNAFLKTPEPPRKLSEGEGVQVEYQTLPTTRGKNSHHIDLVQQGVNTKSLEGRQAEGEVGFFYHQFESLFRLRRKCFGSGCK